MRTLSRLVVTFVCCVVTRERELKWGEKIVSRKETDDEARFIANDIKTLVYPSLLTPSYFTSVRKLSVPSGFCFKTEPRKNKILLHVRFLKISISYRIYYHTQWSKRVFFFLRNNFWIKHVTRRRSIQRCWTATKELPCEIFVRATKKKRFVSETKKQIQQVRCSHSNWSCYSSERYFPHKEVQVVRFLEREKERERDLQVFELHH